MLSNQAFHPKPVQQCPHCSGTYFREVSLQEPARPSYLPVDIVQSPDMFLGSVCAARPVMPSPQGMPGPSRHQVLERFMAGVKQVLEKEEIRRTGPGVSPVCRHAAHSTAGDPITPAGTGTRRRPPDGSTPRGPRPSRWTALAAAGNRGRHAACIRRQGPAVAGAAQVRQCGFTAQGSPRRSKRHRGCHHSGTAAR